jgi:hypothetical protein
MDWYADNNPQSAADDGPSKDPLPPEPP